MCDYCVSEQLAISKEHNVKCFLHEDNVDIIKQYLLNRTINLTRPSCQDLTRWLKDKDPENTIIKPRTLLKNNNLVFDKLILNYIRPIYSICNSFELELLSVMYSWLSIDEPLYIDYNESLYDEDALFNARVKFFKKLAEMEEK